MTSVRINFRENVIATLIFTNYDRKRKLHVIQKGQAICSVSRTINDCEYTVFIKVLRYLPVAQTRIHLKRTINWCGVDLQLSWLKAKWVNSAVASHIYFHELVCARKTKFFCSETDFRHMRYHLHKEIFDFLPHTGWKIEFNQTQTWLICRSNKTFVTFVYV